jgi:hypothetical protein
MECMPANKHQKSNGPGYRLDLDLETDRPDRLVRLSDELSAPAMKSAYEDGIRQDGVDLLEYI